MATAVPERLAGRMLDADAHLYMEPEVMADILRPLGRDWVVDMLERYKASADYAADKVRAGDDPWGVKGLAALGACEPEARVATMDLMGLDRQLAFPNTLGREVRTDTPAAWEVTRAYNDHCLDWTRRSGGRSVGVCEVNLMSRPRALAEARRVIDAGAQAICVSFASPPGGVSPAHPDWDELWHLLADSGVPAFVHIGGCGQFTAEGDDPILVPRALWDSPTLRSAFPERPGSEERIGPIWTVIAPIPMEIVLTALVMGGVFERVPGLRFGIIEFGAQWLGPLVERMDLHASLLAKVGAALPLKPSEYVERNVRVTPFWSEPVDLYISRYGLEGVYVFSTDFPHVEGGKDPVGRFAESLARVSDAAVDRFFVDNAELLFM